MGSYFRGENLSDFELDELNSGNDSGNDNTGKIYEFTPDTIRFAKQAEMNGYIQFENILQQFIGTKLISFVAVV